MASEAQMAANRTNALRSTGPKTRQGKENSRLNALRHGLAARQVVALGEDSADFLAYHDEFRGALSPQDTYEEALVRRLALLSWRLDRVCRIEAGLLEAEDTRHAAYGGRNRADAWPFQMPDLSRYESALDRAFQRTMGLLERRQAARKREALGEALGDALGGAIAGRRLALARAAERQTDILILQNEANLPPAADESANR